MAMYKSSFVNLFEANTFALNRSQWYVLRWHPQRCNNLDDQKSFTITTQMDLKSSARHKWLATNHCQ